MEAVTDDLWALRSEATCQDFDTANPDMYFSFFRVPPMMATARNTVFRYSMRATPQTLR